MMTRHVGLAAALAGVICGSCRPAAPPASDLSSPGVRFFDAGTRAVAQQPGEEFDKVRPAITLENGGRHTVSNCREYLFWTSRGSQPATDYDGTLTPNYLMCAVAALAPLARSPVRSMFEPDAIGEAIYRRLDLRTFVSVLGDSGVHYPADYGFSSVLVMQHEILAETPNLQFSFLALAAGDFDGDGTEDLLVAYTEDAKKGTLYGAMTLLLRRSEPDGDISATVPGPTTAAGQQSPGH